MSKQVMQRALDALEDRMGNLAKADAAIAELRAEIAKPDVEPVGYFYFDRDDFTYKQAKDKISFPSCIKLYTALPDTEAMRRDAELGRVAMRFVDRAGDVHPGIDDAETICADFYKAMCAAIEAQGGGV